MKKVLSGRIFYLSFQFFFFFQQFSTVAMEHDEKLVSSLQNVKVLENPLPEILKKNADITHYLYYGHKKTFLQNIKSKLCLSCIFWYSILDGYSLDF